MKPNSNRNFLFVSLGVGLLMLIMGFVLGRPADENVMPVERSVVVEQKGAIVQKDEPDQNAEHSSRAALDLAMLNIKNERNKLQFAAGVYLNFEVRNTLILSRYCDRYGVDVSPFVSQFLSKHQHIIAHLDDIQIIKESREDWFKMIDRRITPLVHDEMTVVAERFGGNVRDACLYVRESAEDLTKMNSFETFFPEQYKALMSK